MVNTSESISKCLFTTAAAAAARASSARLCSSAFISSSSPVSHGRRVAFLTTQSIARLANGRYFAEKMESTRQNRKGYDAKYHGVPSSDPSKPAYFLHIAVTALLHRVDDALLRDVKRGIAQVSVLRAFSSTRRVFAVIFSFTRENISFSVPPMNST